MAVEFEDVHDIRPMLNREPEKLSFFQRTLMRAGIVDSGKRANAILFFIAALCFAMSVIIFIIGLTITS